MGQGRQGEPEVPNLAGVCSRGSFLLCHRRVAAGTVTWAGDTAVGTGRSQAGRAQYLVGVAEGGAAVTGVPNAIPVPVPLVRVGHSPAVVHGVFDPWKTAHKNPGVNSWIKQRFQDLGVVFVGIPGCWEQL